MNSPKPVVTYREALSRPTVGRMALVVGVKGHPSSSVSNGEHQLVETSLVQSVGENGAFETLNTLYVKEEFNLS